MVKQRAPAATVYGRANGRAVAKKFKAAHCGWRQKIERPGALRRAIHTILLLP